MKHHRLFALALAAAMLAAVPASAARSLLTPDGIRYTLETSSESPQLEIVRTDADTRGRLIVPSTQDAARETQAQIAYDSATDTLFVLWARDNGGFGEVRYATYSSAGHWSPARLISAGSSAYRGVQFVLTHGASEGVTATFMHVAWWSINGNLLDPEYALFAFENGRFVSAEQYNLEDLANAPGGVTTSEVTGAALHPPLVLDRHGDTVDVAYGSVNSTVVTKLNVVTRKVAQPGSDVRIWKPLGRKGGRTPRAGLTSLTSAPVSAYMNNGHLALYTIDDAFRFVVLRKNGTWSRVHTLPIDEDNSAEDLLRELEQTVEELLDDEEGEEETEEPAHM